MSTEPRQQRRPSGPTHPGVFASCAMSSKNPQREFSATNEEGQVAPPRERPSEDHHPAQAELVGVRHPGCPGSEWGKAESGLDRRFSRRRDSLVSRDGETTNGPQRLDPMLRTWPTPESSTCPSARSERPVRSFRLAPSRQDAGRCKFPGTKMMPAAHAIRSLLAMKYRHSHVSVFDEGLALFAGRDSKAFLPHGVAPHPTGLLPTDHAVLVRHREETWPEERPLPRP